MRRTNYKFFLPAILLFALTGCSTISKPGSIPDLKLDAVGRFSQNLSVDLINNQPDVTPRLYAGAGWYTYYANYNEWTQFFIGKLSEELRERGVAILAASPNKLKVKLSDFAYAQGFSVVRVNMKINLEMPEKDWKKEWIANDVSGWSMGRAFGSVIYHAIEQILKDKEIIGLLQSNT